MFWNKLDQNYGSSEVPSEPPAQAESFSPSQSPLSSALTVNGHSLLSSPHLSGEPPWKLHRKIKFSRMVDPEPNS